MDNFSITKYGQPLLEHKYTIDLEKKIFTSAVDDLVLDFTCCHGWTLNTGDFCTFNTSSGCTFNTGHCCIFYSTNYSTFNTGTNCTFSVGTNGTFNTGESCIFLLWQIDTHTFKSYDDCSTILDCMDNKHYLLTKEFIQLQKVKRG